MERNNRSNGQRKIIMYLIQRLNDEKLMANTKNIIDALFYFNHHNDNGNVSLDNKWHEIRQDLREEMKDNQFIMEQIFVFLGTNGLRAFRWEFSRT